jgi:hypothetical protein
VEKYVMPVHERFHSEAVRLKGIFILKETTDDRFSLKSITGFDKTIAVNRITYRSAFLGGPYPASRNDLRSEPWVSYLERVMAIAAQCSAREATRPSRGFRLDELAALIEGDLDSRRPGY